jgi:hypothetical protein
VPAPTTPRRSHALEQFNTHLRSQAGLHILDFGVANQANIDFVTGLGHRLYSEDLLRSLETAFSPEELNGGEISPARLEAFLDESLGFPDQGTDGAMVWDTLQFLPPALMAPVVDRLHRILAPDSTLLALFHPETAPPTSNPHTCKIVDERTLIALPRPMRRKLHGINNRGIEKLFHKYHSVRFFLTRDHLREIIVRR